MAEMYEGAVNDLTDMSEFTEPTEDAEEGAEVEEISETQETAEPAELADEQAEPVEEEQEYEEAEDIPQGKRSRDSAFAEMRRAREEAERRNEELNARLAELERAQKEAELRQYGESIGLSEEEIQDVIEDARAEEEKELARKSLEEENERLNEELLNIQVDRLMAEDLANIQAIDPSVKSLDQLGDDFFQFIGGGMDGIHAYYATKAMKEANSIKPAPKIGKANQASVPRDYYTSEELDALSQEEILANWDKVQRSMDKL